jgi:hypothetical protein
MPDDVTASALSLCLFHAGFLSIASMALGFPVAGMLQGEPYIFLWAIITLATVQPSCSRLVS